MVENPMTSFERLTTGKRADDVWHIRGVPG